MAGDNVGQFDAVGDRPVLEMREFGITLASANGAISITRDISFSVSAGEIVGIVGESGCGKTMTGLAIMGLLPSREWQVSGEIRIAGKNIVGVPEAAMQALRGRQISMVFQEPMTALDPVFTVGSQIAETVRRHFKVSKRSARETAVELLARVGIPSPRERYAAYPHQLSGGMRQRVMIAIALACEPRLLIADEPTTALDVTVQAQILDLILTQSQKLGTALLLITHDLGVVAESCHRMITMYAGQVVEDGEVEIVLTRPSHPYTSGLLRSMPRMSARKAVLPSIRGQVPSPGAMPQGCRFAMRCDWAAKACQEPQVLHRRAGAAVRCCRFDELTLPGVVN
jgi:peptide/nickel transport system ATP-binding protein